LPSGLLASAIINDISQQQSLSVKSIKED